ncbi:hypothetical protein DV517_74630 [Streptomyces sp. S816]|uniref:hypothetical protein n=1 Tax=Streptomyces sp. S816 TaxID=2283197 RepID=UPI00109C608F|nr:hypothetical protein [Streptomyces sp. S816]TGZ12368.1 hypothetical protein DV517_74630 [Streptomyces sp. S816]
MATKITGRTIGASVLDSITMIGGAVVGTAVGRYTHAHTTDRHGSTSRLVASVTAGLTAAVVTEGLLYHLTESSSRAATEPLTTTAGEARPRVAAQTAIDAAYKAKTHWYWRGLYAPAAGDDLWHGYEDGTATCYLAPGLYLRYQPDHHDLGTKRSVGWSQQYTLETGEGTTILFGPAHLVELLDSHQEQADRQTNLTSGCEHHEEVVDAEGLEPEADGDSATV